MRRLPLILFALMLLSYVCAYATDMALYVGHPTDGWYEPGQVLEDAGKITEELEGVLNSVSSFNDDALDDLKDWADTNLHDGEMDIIWLNGCMPSVLYPNPNLEPEGSLAEKWLESGNMFINVADWFAYCTYETGERGPDNGPDGAENIMDLPGIIRFGDGTVMDITDAGKHYLPSLGDEMITDRPVVGSAVVPPWEVAEVFGVQEDGDMDPCVLHNTETEGYVAFINQSLIEHSVDRAQVTIEFIENWVLRDPFAGLTALIEGMDIHAGVRNSLLAKVNAAFSAFERGQPHVAANVLNAFINEVEAQRGKKLTDKQADKLIMYAKKIIAALNANAAPAKHRSLNPRGKLSTVWGKMKEQ